MTITLYIQIGSTNYDEYLKAFLMLCRKCGIIPQYRNFDDEGDLIVNLKEEAKDGNLGNCIIIESFLASTPSEMQGVCIHASANTRLREEELVYGKIENMLETRIKQAQEMLDKLRKK